MKAVNFQDNIPPISNDYCINNYVLVIDLISMQDSTENFHQRGLAGETLRLELNFTFPLEHVTDFFLLGKRKSSVAVDRFDVF